MKKYYYFIFCFLFVLAIAFLQSNLLIKDVANADDVSYIEISSVNDLNKIGIDASYSLNSNYRLTADIDFSHGSDGHYDFLPIGLQTDTASGAYIVQNAFTGIFDGNGYRIKNVQITNKVYSYYNLGIFAYTQNATIKNLAVENIKIERTSVYPNVSSNQSIVYASGLVALAENTIIEKCYVSFSVSTISGTTSIYYGGLVAKAYAGTSVTNSYAISNFTNTLSGEQAIEVKMGGLVGVLENSQVKVAHSKGQIESFVSNTSSEGQLTPITKSAIGGIVGYVSGYNSKIISTYVDMSVYGESINANADNFVGGLVGLISENPASTPKKDNLSYSQIMTKTLNKVSNNYVIVGLNQPFGQINYYDSTTSSLTLLSQNNYEVFNNTSLWSQYVGEFFNKDFIWTFNSDSLPTLQIFTTYQILLKEEETRVNLGENSADAEVISLEFTQGRPNNSFRYGEQVEILISLINGYDYYYYLESVEVSLDTKVTVGVANENYSVVQLEEDIPENISSEKVYLLSYVITDSTKGDISVTLKKVSFDLNVETNDENMGLVRKKDSTVARTEFTQDLQNANTYDFFAVALNNDYAFSKWVFVTQEDGEETIIEMGNFASFAQLTFIFGIGGTDEVTENILGGAKLVAIFTSNVTKVQFNIQVNNQEDGTGAGYISTSIGGEAIDINDLITFQKDIAVTFIANANNGYIFEGWYDGDNRSLSNDTNPTTLNFIPSEDEQVLIARFRVADKTANLLWLWIVLGVIGSIGVGFGIFFIIRSKTGDRAYKNFY